MYINIKEAHHTSCLLNHNMHFPSYPCLNTAVVKSPHNTYKVKFTFKIENATLIPDSIVIISHC